MSKLFGVIGFFILSAFVVVCAYGNDCNCDDELEAVQNAKIYEIVSDYLIGLAYFSIPLELLYFVSRSNIPFKWVLIQFVAFIVLCGLTHVLNAMTYHEQYKHSFLLVVSLTLAKLFTALVSCATAITLLTLIPLLLKWKVREFFLRQNVLELDQEVGMMKKQEEASWHVRMLTREIRKSLDKHTILYTTLVELSKTLDLFNCAVWMPNEDRTEMKLMYELKSNSLKGDLGVHIPINDPDVLEIRGNKGVRILRVESALGVGSGGGTDESGAVAAIRMPMLRVSNFKGGTPELIDTCYAILVLVLPNTEFRTWTDQEMEIVEVVADQVAVALSHASVLEESQLMREQLSEKNRALQQAQNNAVMATQARNSFQKVMSRGMRRPMYSILGLLSIFHHENLTFNQRIIVDTLVRTSNVLSTLVNDVMEIAAKDDGRFPLEMKPFRLHSMIKEVSCLAKCLTAYRGFGFELDVQTTLPDLVLGDERRAFQVILHMVGYLLNAHEGVGTVAFRVSSESNYEDKNDRGMVAWRSNVPTDYAHLKFEIEIKGASSESVKSLASTHMIVRRHNSNEVKESLSFRMCKRLVQVCASFMN